MAAVDGGSTTLYDLGSLMVGAIRTGYLVFDGMDMVHEQISPVQLVKVDRVSAAEHYARVCAEMDVPLHEHPRELDAFIQRLRYLGEMRGALDALDHLEEGDILLLDGSLRSDIPRPGDVLKTVLDQAEARNVTVVGVSKSSSLNRDGIPLLALARHRAGELGLDTWMFPVDPGDSHEHGNVSVVRFHPRSSFAFRVDVYGEQNALGFLRKHSSDPSLIGYPSPLSAIHNRVAISRSAANGISMVLETHLATMPGREDWVGLLRDFHSLLDRGV